MPRLCAQIQHAPAAPQRSSPMPGTDTTHNHHPESPWSKKAGADHCKATAKLAVPDGVRKRDNRRQKKRRLDKLRDVPASSKAPPEQHTERWCESMGPPQDAAIAKQDKQRSSPQQLPLHPTCAPQREESGASGLRVHQQQCGASAQARSGCAPQCGSVRMEFTGPAGWTPKTVARKLQRAMGRSHKAATLTHRGRDGRLTVYQWLAESSCITLVRLPDLSVKLYACCISDDGLLMIAVTCGAKEEHAVDEMLRTASDSEEDAVLPAMQELSIEDGQQPCAEQKPSPTRTDGHFEVKGEKLVVQARVDGVITIQQLKPLTITPVTVGAGVIVGVDVYALQPADTQLQLCLGPVVLDRYSLSAGDVRAMQAEVAELRGLN